MERTGKGRENGGKEITQGLVFKLSFMLEIDTLAN